MTQARLVIHLPLQAADPNARCTSLLCRGVNVLPPRPAANPVAALQDYCSRTMVHRESSRDRIPLGRGSHSGRGR
jgi:hypothetical protein